MTSNQSPTDDAEAWLSLAEVCQMLDLSRQRVTQLDDVLRPVLIQVGQRHHHRLYRPDVVQAVAAERAARRAAVAADLAARRRYTRDVVPLSELRARGGIVTDLKRRGEL